MAESVVRSEALAFVQRCQVVAGPWARCGQPEFDLIEGLTAFVRCLRTVPVMKTHVDRVVVSTAILRMAWNVRRQFGTVAPAGPISPHMPRRDRARLALETLIVHRNDSNIDERTIAATIGVTDSYLSRIICTEVGEHFDALLHAVRMIDVVAMLRTSPVCIKEVALTVGYPGTKSMDRLFDAWIHLTPTAFRFAVLPSTLGVTAILELHRQHPEAGVAEIADTTATDFGAIASLVG